MKAETSFTLAELTHGLDVSIKGDAACRITGVATIQQARPGQLTFLTNAYTNAHYRKFLTETKASGVILTAKDVDDCPVNAIVSQNPYYTYAQMAAAFLPKIQTTSGVDATAIIGKDCHIDPSVYIGPRCVIGDRVHLGPRVRIGAGCVIGDDCVIAEDTSLDANVTLYQQIQLGKRTRLASGVVIGCDGFGFANQQGVWYKVPQLGAVRIGDDVDIGANTSVDRGAIEDTVIENGVKLDNQVQVGHNVLIGEHTIIAGCTAIAGSTSIGKHCMIGGASCFAGHLSVCDNVILTGLSTVTKSITEPGIYSSGLVGAVPNLEFRKNNARFHRLENLMQRIKSLEATVKMMKERECS